MFQVKAISKDVRKTIVPSLMFLFNLSKSVILSVERKYANIIQFSPLNQSNNNIHDFLVRSLCYKENER